VKRNKKSQKNNSRRNDKSSVSMVDKTQLAISRSPVYRIQRVTPYNVTVTPNTGLAATGFDLTFQFTLTSIFVWQGAVQIATVAVPGSSEFTALFSRWRIRKVETCIMYSANDLVPSVAVGPFLPLLYCAAEGTNSYVLTAPTQTTILQNTNLRVVQLGNQRTADGYVVSFDPKADVASSGITFDQDQWIASDIAGLPYNSLAVFYDKQGQTSATVSGVIQFLFKVWYEFDGII